jgi:nitroimidazol reductase NimA-like FMN-containing flavoprotein (pyridoxamine 5'-phosphate oxidase superfamily)
MNAYTPSARSQVRRAHERGSYDVATINAILDAGLIAHVGYVVDGHPHVTPTAYWREGDQVYWHGSSASRMLRTVKEEVPVCLTVTHLDGLVLARSGFHHSINYRSAMLFGRAAIVDDPAAKERALDAFVDRILPGRRPELRLPTPQELKATMVVRMTIEEASAKVRTGPPKDEEEDYGLPVWAGVLPIRQAVGRAVPDPRLPRETPIPAHVSRLGGEDSFDAALAAYAGG